MSGSLAILCPGQGNQHPGLLDRLTGSPEAEAVFQQAAGVLGQDPRELIGSVAPESLFDNRLAQPLICAAELATWAVLKSRLPEPALFCGYSVGELAAYGCAGALEVGETLRLADRRATLMDQAGGKPSGLVAIRGLGEREIATLCDQSSAEIAIVNGSDHFILGGATEILEALEQAALARGAHTVRRLRVGVAAHTSLLAPASHKFLAALEQSAMVDPVRPVLAGIDGIPVRDRSTAVATLAKQLSSTIRWQTCLNTAMEMGCRVFLELGPGTSLTAMVRELSAEVVARSMDEFRSLEGAVDWVNKRLERG